MNFNVVFTDDKSQFDTQFGEVQVVMGPGTGDMLMKVYDPQRRAQDIFKFVEDAVAKLALDKQDKLVGDPGLIVGFDAAGNAVAIEMPESGAPGAPANHASQHAAGGSDPVTPEDIGAAGADHDHGDTYAPAYSWGDVDLEPGVTPLETGKLHFVI